MDERRRVLGVIGQGGPIPELVHGIGRDLGRRAIEAGFRVATGGLGGVMRAACEGARAAPSYREGDLVGIVPGYQHDAANEFVDVVIPTGLGLARNVVLVATCDVLVAVAGGSGTLSEIALAWQLGRPVVALQGPGWGGRLAGQAIDDRRSDRIEPARDPADAIAQALAALQMPAND